MSETLFINEIFLSLQGESSFAGWPCVFIRLAGCSLRCSYCDTAYAFSEGRRMTVEEVVSETQRRATSFSKPGTSLRLPLVELTGGEPLLQPASLPLMRALCDAGWTVLLETNGAMDISPVDGRVHRIMDLKCPDSGEAERNRWENLACLTARDEIKCVIATREDYDWARQEVKDRNLVEICPVLFSWAQPPVSREAGPPLKAIPPSRTLISRRELAERILADALPVRFQAQLHKVIWPPEMRGV